MKEHRELMKKMKKEQSKEFPLDEKGYALGRIKDP